jgi:hypothetical protein
MSTDSKDDGSIPSTAKAYKDAIFAYKSVKTPGADQDKAWAYRSQARDKFHEVLNKDLPDNADQAVALLKAINEIPRHKDCDDFTVTVISSCIKMKKHRALDGVLHAYPWHYRDALTEASCANQLETVREILESKGVRWDYMALMDADWPDVNKEIKALLRSWVPKCNGVYNYFGCLRKPAGPITDKEMQKTLAYEARMLQVGKKHLADICFTMHLVQLWLDA